MNISFPKVYPVTCHTDHVGHNSIFVAIRGYQTDGVQFIPQAIEKGARTIVIQGNVQLSDNVSALIKEKNVTIIRVENTRKALAQLSAQHAGFPAKQLKIIGITGTKGKTTTAFLLHHMLQAAEYKTALLSTVCNKIDTIEFPCALTTAQPDYLHQFFALCIAQNVTHVVMEVAAQALSLHRVDGIQFDATVFTNFSLEHLEFYNTMDEYFQAKCAILKQTKNKAPVFLNADDEWLQNIIPTFEHVQTFGMKSADINFLMNTKTKKQLDIIVQSNNEKYHFVCPTLFGVYNAYNCVAAASVAFKMGVEEHTIANALKMFAPIRGRLETYQLPNGATCIIDYAHNPASYEALLQALRSMTNHLIVVFGAAGKRDASRRPLMGKIAAQFADAIFLTADNPRGESMQTICKDILLGVPDKQKNKFLIEFDRELAIKKAYKLSKKDSMIALLGKGPDEYQIMESKKTYFSERQIILQLSAGEQTL